MGASIAAFAETVIAGAHGESSFRGSAYVFSKNSTGWVQNAWLRPSTNIGTTQFGTSVGIYKDIAVVGAPELGGGSGSAYVFRRNEKTWHEEARLRPAAAPREDRFGWSVAIDNDTIVVGAPHDTSAANSINGDPTDHSAPRSGAAYVFVKTADGWKQQAYLKAANNRRWFEFGQSVAISGNTIVVGAPRENSNHSLGAAYVFGRHGERWHQQAYFKIDKPGEGFGASVSISENTIAVGANKDLSDISRTGDYRTNNSLGYSGAVFVFEGSNGVWLQKTILKASRPKAFEYFGESVSIYGDQMVVGTDNADGCAYLFKKLNGEWSEQARLKGADSIKGDRFGCRVAISKDIVAVGAHYQGTADTNDREGVPPNSLKFSGAVHVFDAMSKSH